MLESHFLLHRLSTAPAPAGCQRSLACRHITRLPPSWRGLLLRDSPFVQGPSLGFRVSLLQCDLILTRDTCKEPISNRVTF